MVTTSRMEAREGEKSRNREGTDNDGRMSAYPKCAKELA